MTTCLGKSRSFSNVRVFRERLVKVCMCTSFPFDFEGGIWDLIILISDHYLSIYSDIK